MRWRRGYRVRPPQGEPDDDPRYAVLPPEARPRGESLQDVPRRLLPYWCDAIVPDLRRYSCVLVVSHGNTLRALIKHLEGLATTRYRGWRYRTRNRCATSSRPAGQVSWASDCRGTFVPSAAGRSSLLHLGRAAWTRGKDPDYWTNRRRDR